MQRYTRLPEFELRGEFNLGSLGQVNTNCVCAAIESVQWKEIGDIYTHVKVATLLSEYEPFQGVPR